METSGGVQLLKGEMQQMPTKKSAEKRHGTRALPKLPVREQIAKRAYELYEQRGWQHGHASEHWLQAEREILKGK